MDGGRQDLRIRPYPRTSLKAARDIRDEQKRLLYEDGINPCAAKRSLRCLSQRPAAAGAGCCCVRGTGPRLWDPFALPRPGLLGFLGSSQSIDTSNPSTAATAR